MPQEGRDDASEERNPNAGSSPNVASEEEQQMQEHNQTMPTAEEEDVPTLIHDIIRPFRRRTVSPQSELESPPSESDSDSTTSAATLPAPLPPHATPEPASPLTADVAPRTSRRQSVENLGPPGSFGRQQLFPDRFATGLRGPPPPSRPRPLSRRSIRREVRSWQRSGIAENTTRRMFHRTMMGYATDPPGSGGQAGRYMLQGSHRTWRWQDVIRLYNARLMMMR